MIKNYITIAMRNLMRQKLYASIHIFGLSLGIACCILMALFVKNEWSHDHFHTHSDRLFRVVTQETRPSGEIKHHTLFPHGMAEELKAEFGQVVRASAFMRGRFRALRDSQVFDGHAGLVSPDFLAMFNFPLLAGDPATVLNRPDAIVISESIAKKYFGVGPSDYRDVLGQTLVLESPELMLEVTGVMADVPNVSSLKFDVLVVAESHKKFAVNHSNGGHAAVYVELVDGQQSQELDGPFKSFASTHLGQRIQDLISWNFIASEDDFTLTLQPLLDIYWSEDVQSSYEASGNLTAVYIMWSLAGLVLLIACSNFTTLSIANSTGRALEVGLRKVLGADRSQVMQQFWSEALLLSVMGLALGIALAELFLPVFNSLVQRDLSIAYRGDAFFLLLLLGIVLVAGLLAGSYPAVALSRFQPVAAMKGEMRIGGRSRLIRTLIVLQYTASIALIICTGVMFEQQHYILTKDLGYDEEQILVSYVDESIMESYKQEILKDSRVTNVTLSDRGFTNGSYTVGCELPDGRSISVRILGVDSDYLSTLKIPLLQGRNFSDDHPTDREEAVLINETLARELGMDDPVGKLLTGLGWNDMKPVIVGVVGDFHIDSFHKPIQPLVLQMKDFTFGPFMLARIKSDRIQETLSMLKKTWQSMVPYEEPMPLRFLDDNLAQQYRDEQRWQQVVSYSAGFTILVSCLGLLGLASLGVARRTKEIGIRKVLGATVPSLVGLLSKDFVKLLIVANVFAWPVAYYAMDEWLANFSYRIDLGLGVFVFSGVVVLTVALCTIVLQTLKAARSNPVDVLKYE